MTDQVGYLKKERDGISDSLTKIIQMYKEIISDMEQKNDLRMKEIQHKLNIEVSKNIESKG